ncbi:MAG: hypothetical protein ACI9XC_000976 [Gammaproteobacteria bacterium]|jgi:hypothetical protein
MFKFEEYILAESDEDILIESSAESVLASLKMVQQAGRSLHIISRNLDPIIYNSQEFIESVKKMVLKSKNNRVQILVSNPESIIKRGHRLIDLSMILTSFIEIKVLGKEHESFNESLFVADQAGYIYRKDTGRYEGKLNFNDKRASRLLIHEFKNLWERSNTDPNLKRALL